jgi:hypothetical protein
MYKIIQPYIYLSFRLYVIQMQESYDPNDVSRIVKK